MQGVRCTFKVATADVRCDAEEKKQPIGCDKILHVSCSCGVECNYADLAKPIRIEGMHLHTPYREQCNASSLH
jgi:hypothetical protein